MNRILSDLEKKLLNRLETIMGETDKEIALRFLDILDRIVWKLLSIRSLVTVAVTWTLCFAVVDSFRIIGLEGGSPELVAFRKEIFFYVMGVFSGIIGSVIASYFGRKDRNPVEIPDADDAKVIPTNPPPENK